MYNVYGVMCETYEEACMVAGIDTPAQIEAEMAWDRVRSEVEHLRLPILATYCDCSKARDRADWLCATDIPF